MKNEEIKEILEFLNDDIMELYLNNRNDNLSEKGKIKLKAYTRLRESLANKEKEQPKQSAEELSIEFTLRLNIDSWGKYKKGDEDKFIINVFDERNGLVRFPIDKQWDIVEYKLLKKYTQTQSVVSDEDIEKELSNHVAEWLGDLTEEDKSVIQCCAEWMRNKLNKSE